MPKSFRNVAFKKMVVLGAEEKCVTTIPGLPYITDSGFAFAPLKMPTAVCTVLRMQTFFLGFPCYTVSCVTSAPCCFTEVGTPVCVCPWCQPGYIMQLYNNKLTNKFTNKHKKCNNETLRNDVRSIWPLMAEMGKTYIFFSFMESIEKVF